MGPAAEGANGARARLLQLTRGVCSIGEAVSSAETDRSPDAPDKLWCANKPATVAHRWSNGYYYPTFIHFHAKAGPRRHLTGKRRIFEHRRTAR